MGRTVPSRYFVDLYEAQRDPWKFASSDYERQKYSRTLEALPRERYHDACELACSIGVFTQMLAPKCDHLTAVDVSAAAVDRARKRCTGERNVNIEQMDLLLEYPKGSFDLTTVCEFGFYFSPGDLERLRNNVVAHSQRGAHVVLVHWTPHVEGHAVEAHDVHAAFAGDRRLRHMRGFDAETYRLDVFERV